MSISESPNFVVWTGDIRVHFRYDANNEFIKEDMVFSYAPNAQDAMTFWPRTGSQANDNIIAAIENFIKTRDPYDLHIEDSERMRHIIDDTNGFE